MNMASLNLIGRISGSATVVLQPRGRRAGRSGQCEVRVRPDEQTFAHMEFSNNRPIHARPAGHPSLVVDATISHATCSGVNARGPKAAARAAKTKLDAMPHPGAMMCRSELWCAPMPRKVVDFQKLNLTTFLTP